MRFPRATLTLIAIWCACSPAVRAQQDTADIPPPHLARVDGTATLDREDVAETVTAGVPLVPGDRVRTERGRVEVLFPDGSALDLDEYSAIEFEGPTLLRMTSGRVILFAAGASNPASAVQFQIDTPVASAQTDGPGEYRVSLTGDPSNPQVEMAVVRGGGALVTELGTMPLRPGERSTAWDNAAPSQPQLFNSARYDAFDQWASGQRDDERLGPRSQSARYLPPDLRMYGGELDRYGSWDYEAPYGYVWYPTVASEWRPYYDGYWAPVPTYGWTWVGLDIWSWPTHHYGRWGYARSRWFWIPDRRWGPAWVSWGDAPGYVSWCPLGFDNRPVFALSVSVGSRYRGWNGWTVVSRDHFGGHRPVRQFAVSPRSLPANIGFVAQRSAPVAPPRAVARRGFDNRGQFAGDRRQFPNVVGRSGDGQPRAVPRRDVNGDRRAEGQATRPDRPASITRSPQAVSRQPQTNGQVQPNGQPQRSEQRDGDRPRAFSRQPQMPGVQMPQVPSAQPSQNGDRQPNGGQNRGFFRSRPSDPRTTNQNPSENRTDSARPRVERPLSPQSPSQTVVPAAPQPFERRQNGPAMRRAEPIRPTQPGQPDNASPGFSRRNGGPIYSQRPAPPPPVTAPAQPATPRFERQQPAPQVERQPQAPRVERQQPAPRIERPPAPPREERSAPPRQERQNNEGRSRGHDNAQPAPNRQDNGDKGGGNGHHRR
jgi:Family of unknown function (DUF6600)/FecR protein